MNLVDSSGWLEYLADGPIADFFARSILVTADFLVPALQAVALMHRPHHVAATGVRYIAKK